MRRGFLVQEERLHEDAVAAAGLSDFGDPGYREGLQQLLAARDASDIDYPEDGATVLGPIRQKLCARLTTLERIKRHGRILPKIERPIFILGLPRTGTTALQRLMMALPGNQGLEYWLGEQPRPRSAHNTWETDPDFKACRAELEAMNAFAPLVAKMHPMAAHLGEECRLVMEQSFGHSSFSLVAPLRPYQDWLFAADLTPHYQHFGQVLRLIGANDDGKNWVLKCPHHAPQVDSLLRAFPDARLVMMHRPPEDLIPSVARLAEAFLGLVEGPGIDMSERARMIVENLDLTLQRLLAVRTLNPERFFNLPMDRFVSNPVEAARQIYARFGLVWDAKTESAAESWVTANGGSHGATAMQSAMPYGLHRDEIIERFSYYTG